MVNKQRHVDVGKDMTDSAQLFPACCAQQRLVPAQSLETLVQTALQGCSSLTTAAVVRDNCCWELP